jgi:hypothetical protein
MAQDVVGRRDVKKELPRFATDDCGAMTGFFGKLTAHADLN